jgi:hypothetical protein
MGWRFNCNAGLLLAFVLLPSGPILAQEYEPPLPQDLAKKIEESECFVIWDVTWNKGKTTGMHEHKLDQVSVTLTEGAVKITKRDGSWMIDQERIGSVRFVPKGTIDEEEGVSVEPSRAIIFQLKDTVPAKWAKTEGTPGQFPRVGTSMLFETNRVIVWDQTWKPGERIGLHFHYSRAAAVFLEGGSLRTISDRGVPEAPLSRKAGDVINIKSPLKAPHAEEGIEGSPRAIWIEFKERSQ